VDDGLLTPLLDVDAPPLRARRAPNGDFLANDRPSLNVGALLAQLDAERFECAERSSRGAASDRTALDLELFAHQREPHLRESFLRRDPHVRRAGLFDFVHSRTLSTQLDRRGLTLVARTFGPVLHASYACSVCAMEVDGPARGPARRNRV
jgi:hypothetical protein